MPRKRARPPPEAPDDADADAAEAEASRARGKRERESARGEASAASAAADAYANDEPRCVACLERPAERLVPCGHAAWCQDCFCACESANPVLSLRCPLCRGVAIAWKGAEPRVVERRAFAAYLLADDTAAFLRALDNVAQATDPTHGLAALARFARVGGLSMRVEAAADGTACVREDFAVVMRVLCAVTREPFSGVERARAASCLIMGTCVGSTTLAATSDADVLNIVETVTQALDDTPLLVLDEILSMGCGDGPNIPFEPHAAISERLVHIATENDTEVGAIAIACVARTRRPDARVFARAVERAPLNPAFASAAVAFAARAPRSAASDVQLTRLAEALLVASPGDALDRASPTHWALIAAGARPVEEAGTLVALSNLRAVFIGPCDRRVRGSVPFDTMYTRLVRVGATPTFNRDGEVIGWMGINPKNLRIVVVASDSPATSGDERAVA